MRESTARVLVGDEMTALAEALGKSGAGALGKRIDVAHVASASEALALLGGQRSRGRRRHPRQGFEFGRPGAIVSALTAQGGAA
jgi:UDP-N-acetylmuramoyl-tripeptide--D-alanyl-D-alanine ligase